MQLITSDESRSVYIMTGKENGFGKVVITSELICTAFVVPTKLTYFSLEAHICVYVLPPPVSYFENWKLIGQSWYYIGVCVCMCVCVWDVALRCPSPWRLLEKPPQKTPFLVYTLLSSSGRHSRFYFHCSQQSDRLIIFDAMPSQERKSSLS